MRTPGVRSIVSELIRGLRACVLCFALAPFAAHADETHATIAAIARQFDRHPLIMLGELHRSREIHVFLQHMLRDPAFICRADDVVVEFGNSRLQDVADAYAAGKPVSDAELARVWRETAVPLTWNSPVYAQVFATVREDNRRHRCDHPLRIVLADPPLDWSTVHTAQEYAPFDVRDASYADVVEREVLARHRRALLIAGELHALRKVPVTMGGDDEHTAAQRIEQRHPGALFTIVTVPLPNAAQALHLGAAPTFRVVHGTALEHADLQFVDYDSQIQQVAVDGKPTWKALPDKHWPSMGEAIDGILWVGGNTSWYPPASIYRDPDYQRELRRHAAIIKEYSGQDFNPTLDQLFEQAAKPDAK